jgi:N-succinyldiaminopimelate aminotransferase
VTFCTATPLQHALAAALRSSNGFFDELTVAYRARRDRLCSGLEKAGFAVLVPQGTYFVLADIRPFGVDDDHAFCRSLPANVGVAAIPLSAFDLSGTGPRHLVRFAFCKRDATLDEAARRLERLRA